MDSLHVIQSSSNTSDEFSTTKTLLDLINGKPEDIAAVYDDGVFKTTRFLTYKDLFTYSRNLANQLIEQGFRGGFVAVYISQMELYPAILLGILSAGGAFYCLDPDTQLEREDWRTLAMLDVKYFILDAKREMQFIPPAGFLFTKLPLEDLLYPFSLLQCDAFFAKPWVNESKVFDYELLGKQIPADKYAYAIKTSGTTGVSKLVLVPHRAIVPNIKSFVQKVFLLTRNDSIFGASPPTFDPSIVEIWMAFLSGGRIVYTSKSIKLNPTELSKVFFRNDISVLQCTPSLLYRLTETGATQLLKSSTSLKIVAFGGEPCPQKSFLEKLIPPSSNVTFYNLYGTTEMSCWASVSIVDLEDFCEPSIMECPVLDTFYKIIQNENGELEMLIGTRRRRCEVFYVYNGHLIDSCGEFNNGDGISYIRTGDTINCDDLPRVTFKSRTDNLIKRNGHFVDLFELEKRIMTIPWLQNAMCYTSHGKIIVIAILTDNFSPAQIWEYRNKIIPEVIKRVAIKNLPNNIVVLDPSSMSLTTNGKFDIKLVKQKLANQYFSQSQLYGTPPEALPYDESDITFIVQDAWEMFLHTEKTNLEDNFLSVGGDSTRAMLFVEHIFQNLHLFGTPTQQEYAPQFLQIVFEKSLLDIIKYVTSVLYPKCHIHIRINNLNSRENSYEAEKLLELQEINSELRKLCISLHQEEEIYPHVIYNLLGCIDSTPTLMKHPEYGPLIISTSNSGYVYIIKCERFQFDQPINNILFREKFPDRIVAPVGNSQDNEYIFIPCCDFRVYAVKLYPITYVVWSFYTGGLLRSRPAVDDVVGVVIVVSESNTVFGLRKCDGLLLWKYKTDLSVLSHNPLLYKSPDPEYDSTRCVFFTTAKGIWKLSISNGNEMHSFPLQDIYTDLVAHLGSSSNLLCCGTLEGHLIHILRHVRNCTEPIATIETGGIINTPIISGIPNMRDAVLIFVTKDGGLGVFRFSESGNFENLDYYKYRMKVDAEPVIISVDKTKGSTIIAFTSSGNLKSTKRQSIPSSRSCPPHTRNCSHRERRTLKNEQGLLLNDNRRSLVLTRFMSESESFRVGATIPIPDSFIPNADTRLTGLVHCVDNIYCFGGRDDCLHFMQLDNIQ